MPNILEQLAKYPLGILMNRRSFLMNLAGCSSIFLLKDNIMSMTMKSRKPNIIVIFTDDLGYGDLGCYGHPTIHTPQLDRMAEEGVRMTSFYVAAPMCTPSRVALLTGRYPIRAGLPGMIGPDSKEYLPESEITIADLLKKAGYRTMAIGKWHVGHQKPELLPTGRGFDNWFGLPYSNDMRQPWVNTEVPLQLYRDTTPIEGPVNQDKLTNSYTEEAIRFIRKSANQPFFLYLAHNMPHLPIHASKEFHGKSIADLYGDVMAELDWSTGRIRDELRKLKIEENTLIIFTSDNGPWLDLPERMLQEGVERWHAGSTGPFRASKGSTYEGGMRVPMIACWPGHLPSGLRSDEMVTTMDFLPTFAKLAGIPLPKDRTYDGKDILPVLLGKASSPHEYFYYYWKEILQGVRYGHWKLRQESQEAPIELYHLGRDPSERYNVADKHPEIVAKLLHRLNSFKNEVVLP